jgi:acetoin utilization protein AcuB
VNVEQVMIAPVVTVDPDTSVERAQELLAHWRCRHLPVVANDTLVGMVSDRDLQAALAAAHAARGAAPNVRTIMHRSTVTVSPETPIEEASRKLADHKIGALPVLDGRRLVGIVTETDLLRHVARRPG